MNRENIHIFNKKGEFWLRYLRTDFGRDLETDLLRYHISDMAGDISPDAVSKDHERFKQKFSRFLKGSERLKLATNKEQFEQNLRVLGEDDSPELGQVAVDEFRIAAGTLLSYQQKRTHGFRGANRALQDSLVAVSRFVAAYSSILDAVSQAAGPYATVGYQTMTILLIVSYNQRIRDSCVLTDAKTQR